MTNLDHHRQTEAPSKRTIQLGSALAYIVKFVLYCLISILVRVIAFAVFYFTGLAGTVRLVYFSFYAIMAAVSLFVADLAFRKAFQLSDPRMSFLLLFGGGGAALAMLAAVQKNLIASATNLGMALSAMLLFAVIRWPNMGSRGGDRRRI